MDLLGKMIVSYQSSVLPLRALLIPFVGRSMLRPYKQDCRNQGLKVASTVLLSFAASVTFTSCSPSFSCTNAMV
jgi:hypothetical protein